MKRLVTALVLSVMAGVSALADTGALDVHDVVAIALERNPALKAIEERLAELDGGIREARSDAFPQVALRSSWSQNRNPSLLNSPDFEEIIDLFPGFEPGTQELYNVSLELSQPLLTSGKVGSAVELAKIAVDIGDMQIETAKLDTAALAAEAYYRVLEAREGLAAIEIQQQTRRESLAVVNARFEIGEATELERLQAEAALAELQPVVDTARGRVTVTEIDLRAVLDLPERAALAVDDLSTPLPGLPAQEAAFTFALEHRPEFEDLELQIAALGAQRKITKADGYPRVDLTGAYGHTVRLLEDIDSSRFQDWNVAVGLSWEIYDGGRRQGQISQLESQGLQLEWQLAALRNRVRQEIESALSDYQTALSRWSASKISARAAREASRVAGESYTEGVAIQADWLSAQEREIDAEVVLVQAYYSAQIGAARLSRALGLRADEAWNLETHNRTDEDETVESRGENS
ncbi:MAG: TolC family protein [Acidobacteriota bacterium]|nr:TolC family protein [Acidobacteriota bacterium]